MINIFIFRCVNLKTWNYYYYFADRLTRNNFLDCPCNKKLSCLRLIIFYVGICFGKPEFLCKVLKFGKVFTLANLYNFFVYMHYKGSGTNFSSTNFRSTVCKSIHIHILISWKEVNLEFFHSLIFNLEKPVLHVKRYKKSKLLDKVYIGWSSCKILINPSK